MDTKMLTLLLEIFIDTVNSTIIKIQKKKNINITIGQNLYKINKIEHHLNKKKKLPTNLKPQNKKYSH